MSRCKTRCCIPRGTGITAYQQAVIDGFLGTEDEWIRYLVENYVKTSITEIIQDTAGNRITGVNMFPDIETGLANTSFYGYFLVPTPNSVIYATLYQHIFDPNIDDSAALLISVYPSKQAIDNLINEIEEKVVLAQDAAQEAVHTKNLALQYKDAAVQAKDDSQTIYDNFDKRFLGAFLDEPTKDNKGNPLEVGALYFSTLIARMFVWVGTFWQTTQDKPRIVPLTPIVNNDTVIIDSFLTDQNYYNISHTSDVDVVIESAPAGLLQGHVVYLVKRSPVTVTVLEGGGVTINSAATKMIRSVNSIVMLVYQGNNTWDLAGDLVVLD